MFGNPGRLVAESLGRGTDSTISAGSAPAENAIPSLLIFYLLPIADIF
jgi:hypothetical protein